ncbi:Sulfotransferase family protein [Flavobacteriaceae bacterium MAR_2010_188]|nr:Sulfotransferase family protein [Flavobacteriaceae bacterium MAR_2010_188]
MSKHIYFLHLPKTAGTSLDVLLKLQYSKKDIHPWDNVNFPELQAKYRDKLLQPQEFKILKGHYTYGIHQYFSGAEDFKYITFLRNPVDRVKSHIRQYLRMPNSYIYKEFKKENNLFNFIRNNSSFGLSNLQTGWISGHNDTTGLDLDKLFHEAILNIEKDFMYVGIVEQFDESLFQIYKLLNWKYKPYYSALNKSSEKEIDNIQFDNDCIKLIEDLNYYDMQLYKKYKAKVILNHSTVNQDEYMTYINRLKLFQKIHVAYLTMKNYIR